jgi:Arc/MetJ family transcription regulator
MPRTTTIRVDPEVYALLVERKQQLERERGHPVSISDAVRDLLREPVDRELDAHALTIEQAVEQIRREDDRQ